jgi:hypothetical protein
LFASHFPTTEKRCLSKNRCYAFRSSHLMEQRTVVRFFILKGLSPKDIYTELESVYIDKALCLPTVYKWHKRFMQRRTELFDDTRSGRPLQNDLVDALRAMIQEFPFTSCKGLCTYFRLAKSTCLRILHDILHLKKVQFTIGRAPSRRRSKG